MENGDVFIEKLHNSDKTKLVSDCFSATEIENGINLIETLNSLYYSQMQSGRKEKEFKDVNLPSLDTIADSTISELAEQFKRVEELFGVSSRYTLGDRIVRSFCHPLGIKGIASAYDYLTKCQAEASHKNAQNAVQKDIVHSVENYIYKGVPSIEHLSSILEDGILAKEYLGVGEARDLTPMDADFSTANIVNESYVQEVREYVDSSYTPRTNLGLADALKESIAYVFSGYKDQSGFIIAVKRDHRFQEEREEKSDKPLYSRDKYGIFKTDNWDLNSPTSTTLSVRTGIPSTSIDYLIAYKENADRMIECVVNNGFYIPIIDFDGNLLLSPKEWIEKKQNTLR